MKKLKLSLDGIEPMNKNQMKKIGGGYGSCAVFCPDGNEVVCGYDEGGSCEQWDDGCYSIQDGVLDIYTC